MATNVSNLLLSLAHAMAAAAGSPAIVLGQALFVHELPASSADPAAVLRIYGGPVESELRPIPVVGVQCMTRAMVASDGLQLSARLYAALHDSANAGRPRQTWSVAGKKIDATTGGVVNDTGVTTWNIRLIVLQQPPGLIGRDDAGRWEIAFNFDVRFTAP